jgi:hypothetical protein
MWCTRAERRFDLVNVQFLAAPFARSATTDEASDFTDAVVPIQVTVRIFDEHYFMVRAVGAIISAHSLEFGW